MTTSNEILTGTYDDMLSIPLEGLQSDSLSFVYKDSGSGVVRQEVITGLSNADEIIVEYGLSEGDQIYLVPPPGAEAKRQAEALRRKESVKDIEPPSNSRNSGGNVIIFD